MLLIIGPDGRLIRVKNLMDQVFSMEDEETGWQYHWSVAEARERAQKMAAESASGIPVDLVALVTPLPAHGGPVPGEIIEHQAHAIGHAAVLLADRGVLLAGDMLSDVLIPLLDPGRPDQLYAYEAALNRLGEAARHADVLIPGHGSVAKGTEVAARLATDHAYIEALRRGDEPVDARWGSRK